MAPFQASCGNFTPDSQALREAMHELIAAYGQPEFEAELSNLRRTACGEELSKGVRRLQLAHCAAVFLKLGFSADSDGILLFQNAIHRRICEGDLELLRLVNEGRNLLQLPPMESLLQEDCAEDYFLRMGELHLDYDLTDLETAFQHDPETSALLSELRARRQPRSLGLSLGTMKVWAHWERLGLPEPLRQRREPQEVAVARCWRPSAAELAEYVAENRPVVISGALDEESFPPLRDFADLTYLKKRCGHRKVKVKGEMCADRSGRNLFLADPAVEMTFGEYLESLAAAEHHGKSPSFYLGKLSLDGMLPELVEDINAAGASPFHLFGECFGANQGGVYTYLGCGRNTSAIHFDPAENLLVVISGTKTLDLYPPTDADCLYPSKSPSCAFASVPPFTPPEQMSAEQLARWPLYCHASPVSVTLEKGDILYLPIFWWHGVTGSLDRNMILNWWCKMHPSKEAIASGSEGAWAVMQRLRTLR